MTKEELYELLGIYRRPDGKLDVRDPIMKKWKTYYGTFYETNTGFYGPSGKLTDEEIKQYGLKRTYKDAD